VKIGPIDHEIIGIQLKRKKTNASKTYSPPAGLPGGLNKIQNLKVNRC